VWKLIFVLLLTGCILDPCEPERHWRVVSDTGVVVVQSYRVAEMPNCVVVSTRPYDPLVEWGYDTILEELECGCR